MTVNADIESYLDYYLAEGFETDFAVMLNGPWGSGKTHFIKGYLVRRQTGAAKSEKHGHLFASLYGVKSTSAITDQFYAQAHPVLNSKTMRILGSVASRALNTWVGSDVNQGEENASIIRDMVLKLEGRILVFDDLERCAMPIAEAMGFINSFVEHEGLKVIVIANEDDIPTDQKENYFRKKEKLIGKGLRVETDPVGVLKGFIDNMNNPAAAKAVRSESVSILETFRESEKQNFRSMRAVLMDFDRLVSVADTRLSETPEALAKLAMFMMATGVENRAGTLGLQALRDLPLNSRSLKMGRLVKPDDLPLSDIERLEAQYSRVDWDDPIVPPSALAKLFETGIVDKVSIDAHLRQHPVIVGYAQTPPWRLLWNWADLPVAQYQEARRALLAQLQRHELRHPGLILHAAGIVLSLSSFGDNLLGNEVDVESFFEMYTEEVRASGNLEPAASLFGIMGGSYGGLGYGAKDSPEFKRIYRAVRSATMSAFDEKMKVTASGLLTKLATGEYDFDVLHAHQNEKFGGVPLLQHINVNEFAAFATREGVLDHSLMAALVARYRSEKHNRQLVQEYEWLASLRSLLEETAAKALPPHQQLLESRINYYFEKMDQSIEASGYVPSSEEEEAAVAEELL